MLPPTDVPDWSVLREGAQALIAALATVYEQDATASGELEQLMRDALRRGHLDLFAARDDGLVTPASAALLLADELEGWLDGAGPDRIADISVTLATLINADSDEALVLIGACRATSAFVEIADGTARLADEVDEGVGSLLALARLLSSGEPPDPACGCAIAALNLLDDEDPRASDVVRFAMRLARQCPGRGDVALALRIREAHILAVTARDDTARLAAFDACEAALRHLLAVPAAHTEELLALCRRIAAAPFLHGLAPAVQLAVACTDDGADDAARARLRRIASVAAPVVDHAGSDESSDIEENLRRWIEIDARRMTLQSAGGTQARAHWSTWSIEHPSFARAIPAGNSVSHEQDLDGLLLTLGHEVTHVLTMLSGVGRCVQALGVALLEVEAQLLTFAPRGAIDWSSPKPMAPEHHHPSALARAEQSIVLSHKLRIVQDAWAPWFEGIAVFGELGAEPVPGDEVMLPSIQVALNLRDVDVGEVARQRGLGAVEAILQLYEESEQRYRDAVAALSRPSLGRYLERYRDKYLAGYLAVRGVVSAWRLTVGSPLSGAAAFRALLHVTRFGSGDAVPDLALDLDTFRREVRERMVQWVARLAAITAADLEWVTTLQPEGARAAWRDGRLVVNTSDVDALREDAGSDLRGRVNEALGTLGPAHADPGRAAGAGSECQQIMALASGRLALTREDRILDDETVATIDGRTGIVPFARGSCAFWLERDTRTLRVLIRNVECHRTEGGPRWGLASANLSEPKAALLAAESRRLCGARLEIVRLIDIATPHEGDEGGFARQYLAYCLGDFVHVQPRGVAMALPLSENLEDWARWRLVHNPVIDMYDAELADGTVGAARTRDWLDRAKAWTDGSRTFELAPWARHVRSLADGLPPPDVQDSHAAGRALAGLVLGDEWGAKMDSRGFHRVRHEGWMGEFVALLDDSARSPVASDWMDARCADISEIVGPLFAPTPHGWDTAPIRIGGDT